MLLWFRILTTWNSPLGRSIAICIGGCIRESFLLVVEIVALRVSQHLVVLDDPILLCFNDSLLSLEVLPHHFAEEVEIKCLLEQLFKPLRLNLVVLVNVVDEYFKDFAKL